MISPSATAIFVSRALLVLLFLPSSAMDKIINFKQAVEQAAEAASDRFVAKMMIFAGVGVEVLMSLAILTGIADRMAALILAGYCVTTALLWATCSETGSSSEVRTRCTRSF